MLEWWGNESKCAFDMRGNSDIQGVCGLTADLSPAVNHLYSARSNNWGNAGAKFICRPYQSE